MEVVYVGSFRIPNFDAAAARVLNIARALRAAGHSVRFISWGGTERAEDLCEEGGYKYDGFPYVITDEIDFKGGALGKIRGWIIQGSKTKAILKEQLGKYDAIITYNCSLVKWLIPFCKKNNIRLITDITEWYEYNELKPIMWPGYVLDMLIYQKRIKNKIVISSFLDRFYHTTNNIIVPATCDATETKWHHLSDVAKLNMDDFDGITLIYAGNPARKDAVHFVINAVNALANEGAKIRFLIIGINKEQYMERYKDLLKEKELNESIKFMGRISQDEVPSYYALSDFMVLLRDSNRKSNAGFPTKFAESFISGTPVIANLTSDLGNYLVDGKTGFVVKEPNEESIYEVLKEQVLPLTAEQISIMKSNVKSMSVKLDYRYHIKAIKDFLDNLE